MRSQSPLPFSTLRRSRADLLFPSLTTHSLPCRSRFHFFLHLLSSYPLLSLSFPFLSFYLIHVHDSSSSFRFFPLTYLQPSNIPLYCSLRHPLACPLSRDDRARSYCIINRASEPFAGWL